MADPEQGNPPNGRGSDSAGSADSVPAVGAEPEAGQTLADGDQTLADIDQTTADSDQTAADDDEAAAVKDQAAADDDQAASDRDFAAGGNPEVHGSSRQVREQTARQRRDANRIRTESALTRDSVAEARDLAASARDQAAALLDRELDERDAAWIAPDGADGESGSEARAKVNRERAAADRALAAEARGRVAYVDVVGLKKVNDEQGHSAGDTLLRDSVRVIRAHLRSYDVIVRVGGDEFVCVLSGAAVRVVRDRFDSVQATLAAESPGGAIKVGIASLESDESANELIGRADTEMQGARDQG